MISADIIQRVCHQIVEKFQPERVILFGSYAYGTPTEDSDVDLLVIMPFEGRSTKKAVEVSREIDYPFALDLIVRTPKDTARRYRGYDPLIRYTLNKGKVLHQSEHQTAIPLERGDELQEILQEWILKAQGDFETATRLWSPRDSRLFGGICLSSQQCIERLLKAVLIKNRQEFPKIRDMVTLGKRVQPFIPEWNLSFEDLQTLTKARQLYEYVGLSAKEEDAEQALNICIQLREKLLDTLGLLPERLRTQKGIS